MFLYANGCSMTYGAELAENPKTTSCVDEKYRLEYSWPGQLTKRLSLKDFFNDGKGGGSNERILRTTLAWTSEYLEKGNPPEKLFVVIGWTAPSRYEIKVNDRWVDVHPNFIPDNDEELRIITKFYAKYITNENVDVIKSLTYVLSLQSWLKHHRIPYLFFNALHFFYKRAEDTGLYLGQVDKKRYFKFDNELYNMHSALANVNMPTGPRLHPLEEGHEFWSKILATYISENNLMGE